MLRNSVVYFMHVARMGSIRAASAELGVAQSAVSRQLQTLEHEMGAALIERYSHGIKLTAAGEALFRHARKASFTLKRGMSEVEDVLGVSHVLIRVAVVESLTSYVFPRAVRSFLADYPKTTLAIDVAKSSAVINAVVADTVDFGICLNAPPSASVDVIARFAEPLFAIVPRRHPLGTRLHITLKDLTEHRLAMSSRSTGVGHALDLGSSRAGLTLDAALETNSLELLRQFVSLGSGIAVMTRQSCIASLLDSEFIALPIEDRHLGTVSSDVVTAPDRPLPLPTERFMHRVMIELRQVVGAGEHIGRDEGSC